MFRQSPRPELWREESGCHTGGLQAKSTRAPVGCGALESSPEPITFLGGTPFPPNMSVRPWAGRSSLQKAGDVVAATGGPHKRVGLHGDVSRHELRWVLATGPAAVAHAVVVHAKPGDMKSEQLHQVSGDTSPLRLPAASPVPGLTCVRSRGRW